MPRKGARSIIRIKDGFEEVDLDPIIIIPTAPPPIFYTRLGRWFLRRYGLVDHGRCGWCGGALYRTEATGQPQQRDHEAGCKFFSRAVQVMRYVQELELAASDAKGRGASRRSQQYLQKSVKELSAAACVGDPIRAIEILADVYAAKYEKGVKPAETAEMLMKAGRALAEGKDPAPITPITPAAR